MVRELLDRANRFRTDLANENRIAAWSETLEALADLVQPWAEEEDAIAKRKGGHGQFLLEWSKRPLAIVRLPDGSRIVVPTARDCRAAQVILTGLLDRQGLLVKRRTVSGPMQRVFEVSEPEIPVSE